MTGECRAFFDELLQVISLLHAKSCKSLEIHNLYAFMPLCGATELQPLTMLEDVTISAHFCPGCSFRDWLISSLNQSPIRVLRVTTLPRNHHFGDNVGTQLLLDRTELLHLNELHISDSHTPVQQLLAFLHPTSNITTLLAGTCGYPLPSKPSLCAMPQLTTLITTPQLAGFLLSSPKKFLNLALSICSI